MPIDGDVEDRPVPFMMVVDSGGASRCDGYPFDVVHDLSSLVSSEQIPVFFRHETGIGLATRVDFLGGKLVASGVLWHSGYDLLGKNLVGSARSGTAWQVSAGTILHELDLVEEGQSVQVNGRSFAGPVLIARNAELLEMSIVQEGEAADRDSYVLIFGSQFFEDYRLETLPSRQTLLASMIAVQRAEMECAAEWDRARADLQRVMVERRSAQLLEAREEDRDRAGLREMNSYHRIVEAREAKSLASAYVRPVSLADEVAQSNQQAADRRQSLMASIVLRSG
jgi:hypothetical protein